MHVRELDKDSNHKTQSKMEAMFIPAHPMTPAEMDASTTVILFGDNNQYYIPFSTEFKYLGSHITPDLKDITNINTVCAKQRHKLQHLALSSTLAPTHGQNVSFSLPS
jgi:hypothetical protein